MLIRLKKKQIHYQMNLDHNKYQLFNQLKWNKIQQLIYQKKINQIKNIRNQINKKTKNIRNQINKQTMILQINKYQIFNNTNKN